MASGCSSPATWARNSADHDVVVTLTSFLQYIVSGIHTGSIYALTALCFTLVFNATHIINFAQGQMVMLGGMSAVALYGAGLPLWASVSLAIAIVALISVVFERIVVRPLLEAGVLAQIVATVGASFVLQTAAMLVWGRNDMSLPAFPGGDAVLAVGGVTISGQTLWIAGLTAVIVVTLQLFYRRSLFGTAVRACAVDPLGARLQGVSYRAVVMFSFAIAGAISAAAGAAFTPATMMSYGFGTMLGLKGFVAATLGGLGSSTGAVAGGYALGIVEALAVGLIPGGSGYKNAIAFLVLLLVLFVRPSGLMGAKAVERQ
jgi:branched-chain amino acid transport system permease protein